MPDKTAISCVRSLGKLSDGQRTHTNRSSALWFRSKFLRVKKRRLNARHRSQDRLPHRRRRKHDPGARAEVTAVVDGPQYDPHHRYGSPVPSLDDAKPGGSFSRNSGGATLLSRYAPLGPIARGCDTLPLTHRVLDASAAERAGLVQYLVPEGEAKSKAQELAAKVSAMAPLTAIE